MDILLFVLRVLIALTLYAFLGIALVYILRERRAQQVVRPLDATLVRLGADNSPAQGVGSSYLLLPNAPTWIGRDPNCAVRVDNEFVSARHARIEWQADRRAWWIEDNNSRNGVLVNDARVMRSELQPLDIIAIGGVRYRFDVGNAPAE
ncbi:MAG: FHA domain-containing protein [Chloroflexi bacterium]|nr:FHA domain-containing protein [Chloroflexota bacterium]MCL5275696.1 FHA domain-containing protein [Chloroflexota bacterium]